MNRAATAGPWLGEACRGLVLTLVLAGAGGSLMAATGDTEKRDASAAAPAPPVPQSRHPSRLEKRVSALAKVLDLDATQQVHVRRVLEWRRQQVRRVWSDPAVPPDYRVTVAHAISDKTAEQIRALLNEEQRNRYKLPRQPHPAAEGDGQRGVEDWMNAMKRK